MNQLQNSELFEKMPVPKAVGKLMVPTVLSSLVMVVYSIADTYFVGLLNNSVQNAAVRLPRLHSSHLMQSITCLVWAVPV